VGNHLVTVTAVFDIHGNAVIADEFFPESDLPAQAKVELVRPDGSTLYAIAEFGTPLVNRHPYIPPSRGCSVLGLSKAQVPIGTEIHLAPETH